MGVRMYTITEYEKLTKVPRKTLRRWIENNRSHTYVKDKNNLLGDRKDGTCGTNESRYR